MKSALLFLFWNPYFLGVWGVKSSTPSLVWSDIKFNELPFIEAKDRHPADYAINFVKSLLRNEQHPFISEGISPPATVVVFLTKNMQTQDFLFQSNAFDNNPTGPFEPIQNVLETHNTVSMPYTDFLKQNTVVESLVSSLKVRLEDAVVLGGANLVSSSLKTADIEEGMADLNLRYKNGQAMPKLVIVDVSNEAQPGKTIETIHKFVKKATDGAYVNYMTSYSNAVTPLVMLQMSASESGTKDPIPMSPDLLAGIFFGFLFSIVVLIAVMCMCTITVPEMFQDKPLVVSKEF
eukprot:Platyproteum_vivax@DN2549_c0_g1_i1.p1